MPLARLPWACVCALMSPGCRSRPCASITVAPAGAFTPGARTSVIVSPWMRRSAGSARWARASSSRPPRTMVSLPAFCLMGLTLACEVVVVVAVYASPMRIGFHLTPFWSPTDRPPTRIIDEAIEVVTAASRMGFAWVSIGQHWLSHPTVWPQPMPMLARLAPETGAMRLKTSVLLLPILNAVEVAESVATLDHITHGRLDVGVAIGYRELELAVAGLARADRVPKLEESLALMKQLWRGETVTFKGRYTRVEGGRMGFTCHQQPHPPLEMGAQSEGATRRAARLTDGVFFGPQLGWADVGRFAAIFREERVATGRGTPGFVGASRSLIVGESKEKAAAAARAYLEKTFT